MKSLDLLEKKKVFIHIGDDHVTNMKPVFGQDKQPVEPILSKRSQKKKLFKTS
jgi:hypothetical protein